jgi:tripartite motif-containing protein 71
MRAFATVLFVTLALAASGPARVVAFEANTISGSNGTGPKADAVRYEYAGGWGERNPPSVVRQIFDMAVGPDGNLYVFYEGADYGTYIQVFAPTGESLRVWGGKEVGLSDIADDGAIAIDGRGTVYVVCESNDPLLRFTPEGGYLGAWTYGRWGETQSFLDLACAPAGTTYVVDGKGRVDRFAANGEHLGDATPSAGPAGEAAEVRAIAVDGKGRFYAATGDKRVGRYESDGSPAGGITWDDEFGSPEEVTVGPDGLIYVSDRYRVRAFDEDGSVRGEWDPGRRDERGEPEPIRGLAIGRDGTVYVGSYYHKDIFCFAEDGAIERMIDATDAPLGYFDKPRGLAVSPAGRVYVVDDAGRVQYFTAEGEALGQWSEYSGLTAFRVIDVASAPGGEVATLYGYAPFMTYYNPDGELERSWPCWGEGRAVEPDAVAISPDGTVYVVPGEGDCKVLRFSAGGKFLGGWGKAGKGPGEFEDWVGGVAVGCEGRVYVSDGRHKRVQYFTRTGKYVGEWSVEASKWSGPDELAVGPSGDVFVCCASEVFRFTADGEFLTKWGGNGTYPGQFKDITGIAVATDGTVYVADARNYRIQYFRPAVSDE